MLKRTKRQLLFITLFVITLVSVHFIYNHAVINKIDYINNVNVNYIDDNLDRYFGTKSRYPIKSEISEDKFSVDSKFKLRQVQLVCRHGTRYPTGSKNYNEKIEYLRDYLYSNSNTLPQHYSFLTLFENPYNVSEYGLLDVQGIKDMQNLAKRAIRRYNNITQTIDDIANVHIYSTNVTRVVDSAAAFVSTFKIHLDDMRKNRVNDNEEANVKHIQDPIFEQDEEETLAIDRRDYEFSEKEINILLETEVDNYEDDFSYFQNDKILKYINIYKDRSQDIVLSPHIACPLFNEEVDSDEKKEINENIKILENNYIQSVINDIKENLHLEEVPSIVGESVMSMCIFEVALNNTRNQFCSLINKSTFENYAFYEDYRNYHIKGYYNEINKWLATPLFKEIINDIDKEILKDELYITKKNTFNTNIVLRFGHAETIFPLVTLLGLYKDKKHLTMKDAPPNNKYIFKSSEISPFASNFWFEIYEIETKYIPNYKPKEDILYVDNPFGNQNVTNILENVINNNSHKTIIKPFTFVIRILLNEREITIPGCSPIVVVDPTTREKTKYTTLCLLSQFKNLYKDILSTTIDDYKAKCHMN